MLKFDVVRGPLLDGSADLLAVGVCGRPDPQDPVLAAVAKTLKVDLAAIAQEELFEGKADQQMALSGRDGLPARRVLLVGVEPTASPYLRTRTFAVAALRYALGLNLRRVALAWSDLWGLDVASWIEAGVVGAETGTYRFVEYLTGDRRPKSSVSSVTLCAPPATEMPPSAQTKKMLERANAVAQALQLARDLVNEPPNVLTPAEMARRAQATAKRVGLKIAVWDEREIARRGFRLLQAVNGGARNPARFIRIDYKPPRPSKRRVVLLGKGLTFDSGGLSIKPTKGMEDMKSDMAGGALVLATMLACALRKPKVEVIGLIPCTENMPGCGAMRPGDIVRSYGGKTVEILNTDAEGRLILADALGYALELEPSVIVDHATLTGACMVALGPNTAGLFSNDDAEAGRLLQAAQFTGELYWRLPLAQDLKEMLRSQVADMRNIGQTYGGAITAALFLSNFVDSVPWIHADIAGPAWAEKPTNYAPQGGTGFGIPTLVRFLES